MICELSYFIILISLLLYMKVTELMILVIIENLNYVIFKKRNI